MPLTPGLPPELSLSSPSESYALPEILPEYSHSGLVLLRVMHDAYNPDADSALRSRALATNYRLQPNSQHILIDFDPVGLGEFQDLTAAFRADPHVAADMVLSNLHAIAGDPKQDQTVNRRRLERYLDTYYSIIQRLDERKYPPDRLEQLKSRRQNLADAIWQAKDRPVEHLRALAGLLI